MKTKKTSKKSSFRKRGSFFEGVLTLHPDGFGFVKVPGEPKDFFVAPEDMAGAFHGDKVLIRTRLHRGRTRGVIEEITKKGPRTLVATLKRSGSILLAVPRDGKFPVPPIIRPGDEGGARPGDLVAVQLDSNAAAQSPKGRIVEVLGRPGDRDVEMKAVIRAKGLPRGFSNALLTEADKVVKEVSKSASKGRVDLRAQNIFTVDGADAKDFDDAISIEKLERGYRLGVHIADVSSYVTTGSELDKEAFERGTSVYLPGMVIPMLPAVLSDNACSLVPHQDRLALSAVMEFSKDGEMKKSRFFPSLIRSVHRGVYEEVDHVLQGKTVDGYELIAPDLKVMAELADRLGKLRRTRGALDFNLPEGHVEMDDRGKVIGLARKTRLASHKLIEEFMLAANEAVAKFLSDQGEPCLYRIHEKPDSEKLNEANKVLRPMGLAFRDVASIKPLDVQSLLKKVEGKPEEYSVAQLVLRSLKQAKYRELRGLHFGLATSTYAHFTSPIRRYPDLVVHRILKDVVGSADKHQSPNGSKHDLGTKTGRKAHYGPWLPKAAEHSSQRERLAQEAEWEALALKQAEFMKDKVGQSFNGIVSGRTSFGLFVLLDDFFVEGLIHGYVIPGWPLPEHLYPVGQALRIKLNKVDVALRRLDFVLESKKPVSRAPKKESLDLSKGGHGAKPNPKEAKRKKRKKKPSGSSKGGHGAKPHPKASKKKAGAGRKKNDNFRKSRKAKKTRGPSRHKS